MESLDHCADNHYRKMVSTVEIVSIWWSRRRKNYLYIDALLYTFSGAFGNHHCRDCFERGVFLILNNNWVYVTWGNASQCVIQFLWLRPVTHHGFGLRHTTFIWWSLTEIQWRNIKAQISKFMGPTWGPPGSCRPQMGPMLAPWILLSGESTPDLIILITIPMASPNKQINLP